MEGGHRPLYPTTGVWWDLNTCPVPAGFDVGLVRPSIELALTRSFGPGSDPVTIFAVGNLDDISHDLLEKISSSGIHLRHTTSGVAKVLGLIHQEWCKRLSRSAFIMLISGDPCWFSHSFTTLGDTILRAYDGPGPEFPHCPATKVWGWESLLIKGYSHSSDVMTTCKARDSFPAWLCFLCEHTTKTFDDFTTHLKSEYHMNNMNNEVSDLNHKHDSYYCNICQYPNHNPITDSSAIYPTTGVWWDLNTCPVPAGFDVGLVRPSIELALTKSFGPRPVTIFAVGNLDDIPVDLLEKISSSGILLRHALIGGIEICELIDREWCMLLPRSAHIMLISGDLRWFFSGGIEICELIDREWCMLLPRSAHIMLISGDLRWFISCFAEVGDTVLRAYDGPPPEFPHCPPLKVWGWESLLKEYSHSGDVITNCPAPERFPAGLCFLCEHPTESFDDLIKHLKSEDHKNELLDLVPYSRRDDKPAYFCELCQYPTYDTYTMAMHYNSEVHAQKAALELSFEKEGSN